MPWVKVSDSFYDHPKFADLTALGIAAWVIGLAYCNRNLTDGRIPKAFARRCLNTDGLCLGISYGPVADHAPDVRPTRTSGAARVASPEHGIRELLDAGLWRDEGSCYVVHDYHDYQPSAEDVLRERASARARVNRWRSAQVPRNAVGNGVTNGVRTALVRPP